MFHFALCLFVSGHSGCSTLHYFCSFQVILDVPLCIMLVRFRSFRMFHFALFFHFTSFWMFHFALCLFVSGHCGCSTLHYFFHFRSFWMFHFALCLFISGHSRCSTLHFFFHFRSFWIFHFALFLFISDHSRSSTLHYFLLFQVIPDVPLCMWAIPESIRPHSGWALSGFSAHESLWFHGWGRTACGVPHRGDAASCRWIYWTEPLRF